MVNSQLVSHIASRGSLLCRFLDFCVSLHLRCSSTRISSTFQVSLLSVAMESYPIGGTDEERLPITYSTVTRSRVCDGCIISKALMQ